MWFADFVRECVALYYLSPKAYHYIRIRGLLKLPSKNTLLRYVGKSNRESGVTPLMKERLKEEAKHLKDEARLCSLVIDEVAISSEYIYDRKMDCFFLAKKQQKKRPAKEVMPPMLFLRTKYCASW